MVPHCWRGRGGGSITVQGSSSSNVSAAQLDWMGTSCYICDSYMGSTCSLQGFLRRGCPSGMALLGISVSPF